MKGDIDLRDIKWNQLRLSRRTWIWVLTVTAVVAAAYLGWRYINNPPRPWLVRWKLERYLKKESLAKDFRVDFPFPTKAEMAKPKEKPESAEMKTGTRTGKSFDDLRDEYLTQKTAAVTLEAAIVRAENEVTETAAQIEALTKQLATTTAAENTNVESNLTSLRAKLAESQKVVARRSELDAKGQALTPIEDDLWDFQKRFAAETGANTGNPELAKARAQFTDEADRRLSTAPSYELMYKIIGEELYVAGRLLESGNPDHRRQGVTLALSAARHANQHAVNGYVAARIAEGYVLPHLDLATDTNRRSTFHEENLLAQCANIFERNQEYNNVVRTYEMYLDSVKTTARADWARERIGSAYEQAGDIKSALDSYREIRDTNSYRFLFQRRIPNLERQLGS